MRSTIRAARGTLVASAVLLLFGAATMALESRKDDLPTARRSLTNALVIVCLCMLIH